MMRPSANVALNVRRGTNISHWLSQSDARGEKRASWFTEDDVRRIADWGFDHIRIPIDEEQMWKEDGSQESEAFDLMDSAMDWAAGAGLKVILDLHILRSHFFNQRSEPKLFTDPEEAEKFAGFWRELSSRLKNRPNDFLGYELMNEAVATDPQDWNRVAMVAFRAIRELEPGRTILLGSNRWNSVLTFDDLFVPEDANTILTFHYYLPMLVTHYRASWWPEGRDYAGPIQYPGRPIPEENWAALSDDDRGRWEAFNEPYSRETMLRDFSQPLAAAKRTGLPLYCGEFGVINLAPQPVRLAWYRDLIATFDDLGIGWGNWDFRGSFGLLDGQRKSTGIAEAMLSV